MLLYILMMGVCFGSAPAPAPVKKDVDVDALGQQLAQLAPAYDSSTEYAAHQAVSERFFRRLTRKNNVRAMIEVFAEELEQNKKTSRINLDGLSSRTRILLFRELTAMADKSAELPFKLGGNEFKISLMYSPDQPGAGIVSDIGKYKEIVPVLGDYDGKDIVRLLMA